MVTGNSRRRLDAYSLFPDLLKKIDRYLRPKKSRVLPPPPPDVSWLGEGLLDEDEAAPDIETALVLITDDEIRTVVAKTLEKYGYRVAYSETVSDALYKLTTVSYAVVVLHTGFEVIASVPNMQVHQHIVKLPMATRRRLFYCILGPQLSTLYDLETLALSANLLVNDADLNHLPVIFAKGFHDYIELFGPLMELLDNQ